jgi:hypothetical protein
MKKKSSKQKKKQKWSKAKQTKRMMFCWDCMARYNMVMWSVKDRCQTNKKAFNEKTKLTKKELDNVLAIDLMIKHSDLFGPNDKEYLEVGSSWEDHGDIQPTVDNVWGLFATLEALSEMAITPPY